MKLNYLIEIENPANHMLKVTINAVKKDSERQVSFFLPSWSPGSYLMREYAKNVRSVQAFNAAGVPLYFDQVDKGVWTLDWDKSGMKAKGNEFSFHYEVYCHELTVRHSHIDLSHAFIHGPSVFMGVLGQEMKGPELEIKFPPLWSKISTGLKDISPRSGNLRYSAPDYDTFIDAPIEMGCHETDGFKYEGIDHELAFYGPVLSHGKNLKKDITSIVKHVADSMGEIPYEKYTFITHFVPNQFGGLEHLNSTVLAFCPFRLNERKDYLKWLELVAHEYFHTWNVKRIRPEELGPFNYLVEAKTKMHWLTEGLTSFMDQLFIFRAELATLEEYLEMMKENIQQFLATPGRKFHTLEDSSFNAWIKLYRPDENSVNSSVSYYLKGGLAFFVLNIYMAKNGKTIFDFIKLLWQSYKERPERGLSREEVFAMIEQVAGVAGLNAFETMVSTTEEIDFEAHLASAGVEVVYENDGKAYLGMNAQFNGDRVSVQNVLLDSPAYRCGLNAGDEILAVDSLRILKKDYESFAKILRPESSYRFLVSRLGRTIELEVCPGVSPKKIKELKVLDRKQAKAILSAGMFE